MENPLRYENKFVCSDLYESDIMSWISLSTFCFRKQYSVRLINNIYYDTFEYAAYSDNLDGISKRSKLRYRWYGDSLYPLKGSIELKNRINSYGFKNSSKINLTGNILSHKDLRSNFKRVVNAEWDIIIQYYCLPIILNRYVRSYYISKCGGIRLTLDQSHEVYDQTLSDKINIHYRAATPEYSVIELKYDPSNYEVVASSIGDIPLRYSKNSKYVNSVKSIMH